MAEDTMVTAVDGPNGKAEIFEVPQLFAGGGQRFEYEVRFKGVKETYKSLGEAYITAGEKAGVKT
ncbi:MAG: hypothetical protein EXR52_02470 [Dehalococcoidia bacterium]|nr:hypothetical protein [Dehalococcoidia bacterium]